MLIRIAVAVNQGDLALVKSVLDGEGIPYVVPNEHSALVGINPSFFPVLIDEQDQEDAVEALRAQNLERFLVNE